MPAAHRASRRSFLAIGSLAGLGLSLPEFLFLRKAQANQSGASPLPVKAESVIHIFLPGGMSSQETFDPKPHAPIEYRGELRSIDTKLRGEQFSELLPRTAQVADKMTIVRSMTHGEAAHERGTHNMFTGYRPSPALMYPSMGSVVSHELGPRNNLPAYICIPNQPNPWAGTGYLSSSFAPFGLGSSPEQGGFKVRDLNLPGGVDQPRYERRREMLDLVNSDFTQRVGADNVSAMDSFYERAFDLVSSPSAREAFNLDAEPAKLRDRYGRNAAGARMLLARRLVEAGARFVTLTYGGWDHHQQITSGVRSIVPPFDQAYSTLLSDLDERGLLDSTLVLITSEFGRTPKINQDGGRDHWPKVFTVALAGGGVHRGTIVGSSGPTATEPQDCPIGPEDLATTIYHLIGIRADKELLAPGARPIEIVAGGQVRKEIVA